MLRRRALLAILLLAALGAAPRPATMFLVGDSTAAQKLATKRPETGWGEALQQYFDVDEVRVENHARNGRSTRTFISEGRWDAVLARLHEGDWVLIQFGHNDGSVDKVDRYTPPADFRRNLARMVTEARARKANPVLLTPVRRRKFDSTGTLVDTHGEYPDLVRAVAAEHRVPLLDLHASTAGLLARHGVEGSRRLFLNLAPGAYANYPAGLDDNTHFSPHGAELVARLVVDAIRDAKLAVAASLKVPVDSSRR